MSPAGTEPAPSSPRFRLAEALRAMTTLLVAADLDDESLGVAADEVEEVGRRLRSVAGPERRARRRPDPSMEPQEFFPSSPIIGFDNPLAPPVHVRVIEGAGGQREVEGWANFDYAYEGPPTCVHGGVIAETFDEILGVANIATDNPGMTASLTVQYRKPTPLRTDLRVEARVTGREGRKIRGWAGIFHGDVLTAEADGLFVEVMPDKFLAIAEGNVGDADPAVLAAIRDEAIRMGAAADVQRVLD